MRVCVWRVYWQSVSDDDDDNDDESVLPLQAPAAPRW